MFFLGGGFVWRGFWWYCWWRIFSLVIISAEVRFLLVLIFTVRFDSLFTNYW
jgi:hypothetical protein